MLEKIIQRLYTFLFKRIESEHPFLKPLFDEYKTVQHYPDLAKISKRLIELEENQIKLSETIDTPPSFVSYPMNVHYQPLVSIIMPLFEPNDQLLKIALNSALHQDYNHFELIIVHHQLNPGQLELLRSIDDKRIVLISSQIRGAADQRNIGLNAARGDIITYLDDDNFWYPNYLQYIVYAFADSEVESTYTPQLVKPSTADEYYIRSNPYDWNDFLYHGGIDGNVFAHRKYLKERYGNWDPNLTRLQDMDLILRYTKNKNPTFVPIIGGEYLENAPGSISNTQPFHFNHWKIKKKNIEKINPGFKVLILTGLYHQVTERYIDYELQALDESGIEFAIWAVEKGVTPDPSVHYKIFYGDLLEAIQGFKPDFIHIYWLHIGVNYRNILEKVNIPVTLRNHGFETNDEVVNQLTVMDSVKRIYAFPQYVQQLENKSKLFPLPTLFSGENFKPSYSKNKRLIVRAGASLPTKGFKDFIDTAVLCPGFEFVLVLGLTNGSGENNQIIKKYNEELGNPVRIIGPLFVQDMADLIKEAGIYMYTLGAESIHGMPVSILEAMASSCIVLVRDSAISRACYSSYALYYQNAEEAAKIINSSAEWEDSYWTKSGFDNSEFIFKNCTAVDGIKPVIQYWQHLLAIRQ
jgi:glycosyltransferase involved in cell wall biosynthesis